LDAGKVKTRLTHRWTSSDADGHQFLKDLVQSSGTPDDGGVKPDAVYSTTTRESLRRRHPRAKMPQDAQPKRRSSREGVVVAHCGRGPARSSEYRALCRQVLEHRRTTCFSIKQSLPPYRLMALDCCRRDERGGQTCGSEAAPSSATMTTVAAAEQNRRQKTTSMIPTGQPMRHMPFSRLEDSRDHRAKNNLQAVLLSAFVP